MKINGKTPASIPIYDHVTLFKFENEEVIFSLLRQLCIFHLIQNCISEELGGRGLISFTFLDAFEIVEILWGCCRQCPHIKK